MKKNLPAKLIILALLFIAFFGYNAYNRWNHSHFTVDSKAFHIVKSYQALIQNQKKMSPQVSLAYQYQLLKTINRTVTLPNLKRKVTIHKVWYNQPNLYLLYSVNLLKSDKKPADVPQLNFTNIIFHSTHHTMVKTNAMNITMSNTHPGFDSEVYHDELYRGILLQSTSSGDPNKFYNVLNHLGRIDLTGSSLIVPNKGYVVLNNLKKVNYEYHQGDDVLFQKKLNQTVQLNNGVQLYFSKLKAEVNAKYLYFTTNQPSQLPDYLDIRTNNVANGRIYRTPVWHTSDGKRYAIPVNAGSTVQKQFQMSILKTETFGKGVQLKIPSKSTPGALIGEAYGCHFYFGGIKKISSVQDYLIIKWDNPSGINQSSSNHLGQFQVVTKSEAQNLTKHQPKEWHNFKIKQNYSLLSITNEKGKHATVFQAMSGQTSNKYETVNIVLKRSFVEHAQTLTVALNQLPYTKLIKNQKISVSLPKINQ